MTRATWITATALNTRHAPDGVPRSRSRRDRLFPAAQANTGEVPIWVTSPLAALHTTAVRCGFPPTERFGPPAGIAPCFWNFVGDSARPGRATTICPSSRFECPSGDRHRSSKGEKRVRAVGRTPPPSLRKGPRSPFFMLDEAGVQPSASTRWFDYSDAPAKRGNTGNRKIRPFDIS